MDKTWEEYSELEADRKDAASLLELNCPLLPPSLRQKHVNGAGDYWEEFYVHNSNKFFKDRNYLPLQFQSLLPSSQQRVFLECGSGVGNTLFPVAKSQPNAYFYATDFSPTAIHVLQKNPSYNEEQMTAFVSDLSEEGALENIIEENSVDVVTMIFFMSAIPPEKMSIVLLNVTKVLKKGGIILFRDYGKYDLTQIRFLTKKQSHKLEDSLYVRSDGTLSYYFQQEELTRLFTSYGYEEEENRFDVRQLKNRKRKITMYRVWISAIFRKANEVCGSE
eukprot:CAMPEP_0174253676 /NCGR_PEP_ID=MMETSP0439-20130205/3046_1 /TAXON_ID=0 /ORGANISM="Stereomyxa ramosa, Strain Chinc5" /LENGTH=276 /DNA_ID=CAMNT_0015334837 /DNA_START=216 /DNA_END=1046 /DNA_ORIENTATION=-